ncbi:MAG: PEP-CTERM sorting domain-containing protein [Bryobacteraceae bacterium]
MKSVVTNAFWVAAFLIVTSVPVFAGGASASPVPEPSTVLLVAGAGGALLLIRRLRNKK